MLGAALAAVDLFYVQGPRGAWLWRLGFGRTVLARTCLFTALIGAIFALNRLVFGLLHGFERSGLDYFGLPWLRGTLLAFAVFLVISEFLQMRRVIGGRTLTNLMLGRYHRSVREQMLHALRPRHASAAQMLEFGERIRARLEETAHSLDHADMLYDEGGQFRRP